MAEVKVLYNTVTGDVVTVTPEEVEAPTGDLAIVLMDDSLLNNQQNVLFCTFDGVSTFTEWEQSKFDAYYQQLDDEKEAARLMRIEADDATAKEAKKIVGLTQGVIDELTKKEK